MSNPEIKLSLWRLGDNLDSSNPIAPILVPHPLLLPSANNIETL